MKSRKLTEVIKQVFKVTSNKEYFREAKYGEPTQTKIEKTVKQKRYKDEL